MMMMREHLTSGIAVALSLTLCACSSDDSETTQVEGGSFRITASGEALALTGYDFPPVAGQEVVLADGWELRFERALVVVDHVHLSLTPDRSPTDQSQLGDEVAELAGGPFALDLATDGPGTVTGKSGDDRAYPLGVIAERDDGKSFDPATRYGFSFAFVPASDSAARLGIDETDADYARMVSEGLTHLLIGVATRRQPVSECSVTGEFAYSELPEVVRFELGLTLPVTNVNCQNPELTGQPISDAEESPRGVQAKAGESVDVQVTVHTDHLFWNTLAHGAVPQFNQLAARAREVDGEYVVTLDDLTGAPLVGPAEDAAGNPLGFMSCLAADEYTLPTQPIFTFDTEGQAIDDMRAFVLASASTMGHLNQDGLCYVEGSAHTH